MHTFLDNFHQSGKYSAQLASHQAELRRERESILIKNSWTFYHYRQNIWILTAVNQDPVNIMKKQTLTRQSAHIVELITIMWKNVSKRWERKKRKLVLLVLHLTKIWIVQLRNALDADLKIIWLLCRLSAWWLANWAEYFPLWWKLSRNVCIIWSSE